MREKILDRRGVILDAARSAFFEHGYEATSMAEISARIGGSKQTLYSYFASKEDLFVAMMMEKGAAELAPVFDSMREDLDLRSSLRAFGVTFLTFILSDDVLAMRRIIISEGARSDLGVLFFEHGAKPGWARVSDYLAQQMGRGALRCSDSERAAMHLQGLLEAGPYQLRLAGARGAVVMEEITRTVDEAVDLFLRAYAPD
jgi:AcrR family transcriptional regulator